MAKKNERMWFSPMKALGPWAVTRHWLKDTGECHEQGRKVAGWGYKVERHYSLEGDAKRVATALNQLCNRYTRIRDHRPAKKT